MKGFLDISTQMGSKVEVMKPRPQHRIGLDARTPDFVACKQQSRGQPMHWLGLMGAFVILYLKKNNN